MMSSLLSYIAEHVCAMAEGWQPEDHQVTKEASMSSRYSGSASAQCLIVIGVVSQAGSVSSGSVVIPGRDFAGMVSQWIATSSYHVEWCCGAP